MSILVFDFSLQLSCTATRTYIGEVYSEFPCSVEFTPKKEHEGLKL